MSNLKASLYEKVLEFLQRGEEIGESEYHPTNEGFPFPYVSGSMFDVWMNEINIFNERHLQGHPLYKNIYSTYFHRKYRPSAFEDMMGHLRALASDDEFFREIPQRKDKATTMKGKKQLISYFQRILSVVNNF